MARGGQHFRSGHTVGIEICMNADFFFCSSEGQLTSDNVIMEIYVLGHSQKLGPDQRIFLSVTTRIIPVPDAVLAAENPPSLSQPIRGTKPAWFIPAKCIRFPHRLRGRATTLPVCWIPVLSVPAGCVENQFTHQPCGTSYTELYFQTRCFSAYDSISNTQQGRN